MPRNPVNRSPHYLESALATYINRQDREMALEVIKLIAELSLKNFSTGPSFSWLDNNDQSFLLLALKHGLLRVAEALISNQQNNTYLLFSADVITQKTTLHYALENGYNDIATCIMNLAHQQSEGSLGHAFWLVRDCLHKIPLHYAVNQSINQVKILLNSPQDAVELLNHVNTIDGDANTPLHLTSNAEVALELISHGSNLELENKTKQHPLHRLIPNDVLLLHIAGAFRYRRLSIQIREIILGFSPGVVARTSSNLFAGNSNANQLLANYMPSERLHYQEIHDEFNFLERLKARLLVDKARMQAMPTRHFSPIGLVKWSPVVIVTLGVYVCFTLAIVKLINSRLLTEKTDSSFSKKHINNNPSSEDVTNLLSIFCFFWSVIGGYGVYRIIAQAFGGIIPKSTGKEIIRANCEITQESILDKICNNPLLRRVGIDLKYIMRQLQEDYSLDTHQLLVDRAVICLTNLQNKLIAHDIVLGFPSMSVVEEDEHVVEEDLPDDVEMQLVRNRNTTHDTAALEEIMPAPTETSALLPEQELTRRRYG